MAYGEYFDPAMLDLMMGGFTGSTAPGGGRGKHTELDMEGLGPDPDEEFTGDTMQEFYDYLMKPRHRREQWSSPGGGMHGFGPAREASVSPQNIQMAEMIQKRMQEDRMQTENERRMTEAQGVMTGRGPSAGGEITFGGVTEKIGPKGPLSPEEQVTAMAGGMPVEPLIAAQAKQAQVQERRRNDIEDQIRRYEEDATELDLKGSKFVENFEKERPKHEGQGGQLMNHVGISAQELKEMWKAGELPPGLQSFLGQHFTQWDEHVEAAKSLRAQAAALRESLGAGTEGGNARVDKYIDQGTGQVLDTGP